MLLTILQGTEQRSRNKELPRPKCSEVEKFGCRHYSLQSKTSTKGVCTCLMGGYLRKHSHSTNVYVFHTFPGIVSCLEYKNQQDFS